MFYDFEDVLEEATELKKSFPNVDHDDIARLVMVLNLMKFAILKQVEEGDKRDHVIDHIRYWIDLSDAHREKKHV